jgi:hypothetical protein
MAAALTMIIVLDGEFEIEVDDRRFVACPSTFVPGPRHVSHRFWDAGNAPGQFLLVASPPDLEPYFEEFSRLIAESPEDLARQAELASQYGFEFV